MPGCTRLRVNPQRPEVAVVRRGAETISRGGVIAGPTDTIYGLFADAWNRSALRRVFRIKGRPENKPILVLVDSLKRVRDVADSIPDAFEVLAEAFWPGPLTVVVARRPGVPDAITAGRETIAVRLPRSPLVRALARQARCPLTGTSANLSGRPGARSADEVFSQLGSRLPLLLDAGRSPRGTPSTLVDLASSTPCVLRAGRIPSAAIAFALQRAGLDRQAQQLLAGDR